MPEYILYRNNAATDTLPTEGSDLDCAWDTLVKSVGTVISYSAGEFNLADIGSYLVLYGEGFYTSSTTNNERINAQGILVLDSTELEVGRSQGYIRKASGQQSMVLHGAGIVKTTSTNQKLITRFTRDDNSTTGSPTRIANYAGSVIILKLDPTWEVASYRASASQSLANSYTTTGFDTTIEQDASFSLASNTVTMTGAGKLLALYSMDITSSSTNVRVEPKFFTLVNNTFTAGRYSQSFMRGTDSTQRSGNNNIGLINYVDGDFFEVGGSDNCGTTNGTINTATLQLVKLPAGAETIVIEATTGDFNTANTDFTWDTNTQIDSAAFSTTQPSTDVTVLQDDDYLFLAGQNNTGVAATRAYPTARFAKNTVAVAQAGDGAYNRNSGSADAAALNIATIITGLVNGDDIQVQNNRLATAATAINNDNGAFAGIRIGSLFPSGPVTIEASLSFGLEAGQTASKIAELNAVIVYGSEYDILPTGAVVSVSAVTTGTMIPTSTANEMKVVGRTIVITINNDTLIP